MHEVASSLQSTTSNINFISAPRNDISAAQGANQLSAEKAREIRRL